MNRHSTYAAWALLMAALTTQAALVPLAHYNLHGTGGIRDLAAPEVWKNATPSGPDLARQGEPKMMSDAPEPRRQVSDSSIKFEQPDQCYSVARNLLNGDNFVVETWAYALKAVDSGWHSVLANGNGGTGFLPAQNGDRWSVLVGGTGGTSLGRRHPKTRTHLAIVKSLRRVSGWINGRRVCDLPDLGGGAQNFSIGATAPGTKPFNGWISEVCCSSFKPGQFDPANHFLLDGEGMRTLEARGSAAGDTRGSASVGVQ